MLDEIRMCCRKEVKRQVQSLPGSGNISGQRLEK